MKSRITASSVLGPLLVLAGCGDNIRGTPNDARPDVSVDACVPTADRPQLESLMTGDLAVSAAQASALAPVAAVPERSILFTTIRELEPSPRHGATVCRLAPADITSGAPAGVLCKRPTAGTDNAASTGDIHVRWTVVTFASGVTVQRGVADTNLTNPQSVTLTPAIDLAKSFVLIGGSFAGGTGWSSNDFVRAKLVDGSTLEIKTADIGAETAWQVVTMSGSTVQRGTAMLATADLTATSAITAIPADHSLVLATYNTDNVSGIAAASLLVDATVSGTTLKLERTAGGAAVDAAWEVIVLPFATHHGVTTFAPSEKSKTETATGVTATSAVALGSSQATLGQGTGTTDYAGADVDLLGDGATTMTVGAGSVDLQRESATGTATIPWTTIDFTAGCP